MDPLASRDLWPAGAQPPERTVLATTTNYIRRVLSTDYFAERSRSRVSRAATELRHPYILFRFDFNIVFSFFLILFDLHLYPRSRIHSDTLSRLYIGIRSVLDTRTDIRSYFLPFQSASSILRSFDIFLQRR